MYFPHIEIMSISLINLQLQLSPRSLQEAGEAGDCVCVSKRQDLPADTDFIK